MNNKNSKEVIYLNSMFNDAMTFVSDIVQQNSLKNSSILDNSWTYIDRTYIQPKKIWELLDFPQFYNNYNFKLYTKDDLNSIPKYPVSNYSIDEKGNSIIEIAITGFSEDEISIQKIESKIIVKGKKDKIESTKKYLYKNIACRTFELEFEGADSWDYSKIDASIDKGILTIIIPVKEECKPQEIQIKKK